MIVFYLQHSHDQCIKSKLNELSLTLRESAKTKRAKRQRQYVLGRHSLLTAAQRLGNQIEIYDRDGLGPRLMIDGIHWHCSLSHCHTRSHDYVAAVISENQVGLDVECVRGAWSAEKVSLFCTELEANNGFALATSDLQNEFFTRCWSRKEAISKRFQRSVWSKETISENLLDHHHITDFTLPLSEDGSRVVGALYCESSRQLQFERL